MVSLSRTRLMLLEMEAYPSIWSRIAHSTSQAMPAVPSAGTGPSLEIHHGTVREEV